MRLLAPALAAIRSTRAPARPWAANSCLAASRMRSRMPSGSRCHFKIRFALAKSVARDGGRSDVARTTGLKKEWALLLFSPCVLGEGCAGDGSCFLEVDTALILLASTATDGHG